MKYNLKDIIIFTYVAKLRSFARASEILNISRTVVSTRVGELEKLLGINLLARTTREVNLTSDGKVFFDHCNSILEKVENLDEFLYKYKGIIGTLRMVLPPYFSRHYIIPHLNEFLKKYPGLKLDISLTENPVNIISEGYDLQIRIHIPKDEALQVAKLMKNPKVICAAADYINKFGTPLKPKDLKHHNCLIGGEDNIWKFKNKKNHEIISLDDLSGNIKCDSGEIMKELLLAGMGVAATSPIDIEKEIVAGNLILLLDNYEFLSDAEFYAVYPAGKYVSPKVKAFIDFFQEKFADKEKHGDIEINKQSKNKTFKPSVLIADSETAENKTKSDILKLPN